ncbi:MAG: hypothetical protein JSS81_04245 [Acidobacteria bacterium]|nr:hypothetical protein [Acidobacteriota bacterium]
MLKKLLFVSILLSATALSAAAQTSAFTYQGRLTDANSAASGSYDFYFQIFDAASGGTFLGADFADNAVVANGIFTVVLDFGTAPFQTGAPRYLEISVRPGASTGAFTTLTPRQSITSAPYALQSLKAGTADSLSTACFLCVTDAQIQALDGAKVAGPVAVAQTANALNGILPVANGGTGSATKNFVDLSTDQPTIAGNKTFTGAVGVTGANGVFNGNGAGLTNLNGANIANGSVTAVQLAADAQPNGGSLKMLGALRWDLLKAETTFPTGAGSGPSRLAFDGSNMWVTLFNANAVAKIRTSDGAVLGTYNGVTHPFGIAFDGANIWVANNNGFGVTKIRASDGAALGTFTVGSVPNDVAFDGTNVWISSNGSASVTKLRASDGANLGTFTVATGPTALVFDGSNMWVLCGGGALVKLRASDGANLGSFSVANGNDFVFDGTNLWAASGSNVVKIRPSDGANLGTFPVGAAVDQIVFDGANLWISTSGGNIVTKLRTSDGAVLGTFPTGGFPSGMAFDGANVWVANGTGSSVTRLSPAFSQ